MHRFVQHFPDVGDSEAIEQVGQGDGEGADDAEQQQEELEDEGKGVRGVGGDVAVVNLPDQPG